MTPESGPTNSVVHVLNHCLEAVVKWIRMNKLKFSTDKKGVLLLNSSFVQGSVTQPVLEIITLPLKHHIYSLGMLISPAL